MPSHEYRVVPAPRRGVKAKGARTPEDRFARAVEAEMNRMAAEGWEFVRSDTLLCEQKSSWFSRPSTVFQTLLVFRRPAAEAEVQVTKAAMPPPVALTQPVSAAPPAPAASRFTPLPTAPAAANVAAPTAAPPPGPALTLVGDRPSSGEPPAPRHPFLDDLSQALGRPAPDAESGSRHAAE